MKMIDCMAIRLTPAANRMRRLYCSYFFTCNSAFRNCFSRTIKFTLRVSHNSCPFGAGVLRQAPHDKVYHFISFAATSKKTLLNSISPKMGHYNCRKTFLYEIIQILNEFLPKYDRRQQAYLLILSCLINPSAILPKPSAQSSHRLQTYGCIF